MRDETTIGLVGCGTMGRNHARVVAESSAAHLAVVYDTNEIRAKEISQEFGGRASADVKDLQRCDAVIVASPTETHAEIATALLEAGVPVLVEKPLAPTLDEAKRLVELAAGLDQVLMCGFVERFNPAFVATMTMTSGSPLHLTCTRHSPAAPRIQTHVVHDLLIHDIDLVLQLMGPDDSVVEVTGFTSDPLGRGVPDIADCMIRFRSGTIASLSASRATHRKVRHLAVNDGDQLIDVDLLRQNVDVYRHVRHELVGSTPSYRAETVHDIPFVRRPGEPLALQLEHFLRLLTGEADVEAERRRLLPAHEVASALT